MSFLDALNPSVPAGPPEHLCAAKGCTALATQAIRWNNPKLHTPDRRKIWLACPDHIASLSQFLQVRGFLRDVVDVKDLPPESAQASAEQAQPDLP